MESWGCVDLIMEVFIILDLFSIKAWQIKVSFQEKLLVFLLVIVVNNLMLVLERGIPRQFYLVAR